MKLIRRRLSYYKKGEEIIPPPPPPAPDPYLYIRMNRNVDGYAVYAYPVSDPSKKISTSTTHAVFLQVPVNTVCVIGVERPSVNPDTFLGFYTYDDVAYTQGATLLTTSLTRNVPIDKNTYIEARFDNTGYITIVAVPMAGNKKNTGYIESSAWGKVYHPIQIHFS